MSKNESHLTTLTLGRGSVYELDRQAKCHRTESVTELDEIEKAFFKNAY